MGVLGTLVFWLIYPIIWIAYILYDAYWHVRYYLENEA